MAVYQGTTLIAEKNPAQISAAEITAGTETGLRSASPKDMADLAAAHGGGGIGNLEFFGRTTDLTFTTAFQQVVGGNYTPASTSEIVGLLVSAGDIRSTTTQYPIYELRRGGTAFTPAFRGGPTRWGRQLFLDKPASTSQQTYSLQGRRVGTTAAAISGTSLSAFAMPDGVVADILTADETHAQNSDILSVSITPSSTSAKIKLNVLLMSTGAALFVALRRDSTQLVAVTSDPHTETDISDFPSNFEDWVDEPNTTSEVTYTVRNTGGASGILKGSYLMAQEVA